MSGNPELPYWIALRRAGLGSASFARLLARFSTIGTAWEAPAAELIDAGLDRRYAAAMQRARSRFDPEGELNLLAQAGARAYTWMDSDYPPALADIVESPPVLFVRGTASPGPDRAVAIVGTRRITPYGRQATEAFASALAQAGATIVSGLARGVDAVAHRVAVEHGTPTIAVLGGGVDQVYPRENAGLAQRIMENGCLVSEYPPQTRSRADHFPRRNRIISGLSQATLVVEAGQGSGALHTANWAFEQGRDVFAVPGSIFSEQSTATNQLIHEHTARLVMTPEQLCEELNLIALGGQRRMPEPIPPAEPARIAEVTAEQAVAPAAPPPGATEEEAALLNRLSTGPQHVDELVRALGFAVPRVSSLLQMMALKGMVREVAPMTYGRAEPADF